MGLVGLVGGGGMVGRDIFGGGGRRGDVHGCGLVGGGGMVDMVGAGMVGAGGMVGMVGARIRPGRGNQRPCRCSAATDENAARSCFGGRVSVPASGGSMA